MDVRWIRAGFSAVRWIADLGGIFIELSLDPRGLSNLFSQDFFRILVVCLIFVRPPPDFRWKLIGFSLDSHYMFVLLGYWFSLGFVLCSLDSR